MDPSAVPSNSGFDEAHAEAVVNGKTKTVTLRVAVSKKLPITGIDYSSASAEADMTIELEVESDARQDLLKRYASMLSLVEEAVNTKLRLMGC